MLLVNGTNPRKRSGLGGTGMVHTFQRGGIKIEQPPGENRPVVLLRFGFTVFAHTLAERLVLDELENGLGKLFDIARAGR